jgi:hypothetical protein
LSKRIFTGTMMSDAVAAIAAKLTPAMRRVLKRIPDGTVRRKVGYPNRSYIANEYPRRSVTTVVRVLSLRDLIERDADTQTRWHVQWRLTPLGTAVLAHLLSASVGKCGGHSELRG